MVMIEAMACGTPVVALRGGAVAEVVVDGVTGYVCDDPGQLPAALRRLDRIDSAACRRRVVEEFDIDTLGAGYEAVYRAVLASRGNHSTIQSTTPSDQPDGLELHRGAYGHLDGAADRRYSHDTRIVRRPGSRPQPSTGSQGVAPSGP